MRKTLCLTISVCHVAVKHLTASPKPSGQCKSTASERTARCVRGRILNELFVDEQVFNVSL
jgi:hypothetical protein